MASLAGERVTPKDVWVRIPAYVLTAMVRALGRCDELMGLEIDCLEALCNHRGSCGSIEKAGGKSGLSHERGHPGGKKRVRAFCKQESTSARPFRLEKIRCSQEQVQRWGTELETLGQAGEGLVGP